MPLPDGVADILPLTPAQQGMLFHVLEAPQIEGRYVAVVSATLTGPLDPVRLQHAFDAAVNGRDAYRACFVWEGVKQPVQPLRTKVDVPWALLDWRGTPDPDARLQALIDSERRRAFDLARAPLMAVTLIRQDATRWQLVWTIHHLISDGWSTSVVLRDIFARYTDPAMARPKAASFKQHILWLRKKAPAFDRAYWETRLEGLEGPCLLPDRPMDSSATPGHLIRPLGAALLQDVTALAQRHGITPHSVLASAWAMVLRAELGQDDIIFGQTFAGRPAGLPGSAHAAGPFINTLPFRVRVDPVQTVSDFLRAQGQTHQAQTAHEFAALSEVQACAPLPRGTPLFDTVFVNEGTAQAGDLVFGDITLSDVETVQSSNYALAMLATPHGSLKTELYFDPARVDPTQAERCLDRYAATLAAFVAHPDAPLRQLAWHGVKPLDLPDAPDFDTVLQRFTQMAETHPDAPALSDDHETLSYASLALRARCYAQALANAGAGNGDVVPVALPRGADAIAAFLGVMMTGAAYVPLDLTYPTARIAQILDAVAPQIVISNDAALPALPDHAAQIISAEALAGPLPLSQVADGDAAYIIFTSGSQGKPKGVVISPAALAYSTGVRDRVYGASPTCFLLLSSLAFDSSVAGIYWSLATGGHLVVAGHRAEQDPVALARVIERHGITHTLCLPSLAEILINAAPARALRSLDTIIAAGETLPGSLVETCTAALPDCRLINEYGPTETTVWCSSFDVTASPAHTPVPIGHAMPGSWMGVVDQDLRPLPAGQIGEIAVAGPHLATGYWRNEAEAEARFRTIGPTGPRAYLTGDLGRQDADGVVTFLGRKDTQIKIRGHRVELSEIERVAQQVLPGAELAAILDPTTPTPAIALMLEDPDTSLDLAPLKAHLSATLPAAFQPARIQQTSAFARLPNGKVDRTNLHKLLRPSSAQAAGTAPRTKLEKQIATLFATALGTTPLGRHDNFFDHGGDSLKTISVYAQAAKQGIVFNPTDVFTHPTVAGLAQHLEAISGTHYHREDRGALQVANATGTQTAVFIVHGSITLFNQVARGLGPDHPVGLLFADHFYGFAPPFGKSISTLASEAIAAMHSLHPTGPYVICGYSVGCAIAMEMITQLNNKDANALVVLDPPYDMLGSDPARQAAQTRGIKRWQHILQRRLRLARFAFRVPLHRRQYLSDPQNEEQRMKCVGLAYSQALSAYAMPVLSLPTHVFVTPDSPSMVPGGVIDSHLTDKTITPLDMSHEDLTHRPEAIIPIASTLITAARDAKG